MGNSKSQYPVSAEVPDELTTFIGKGLPTDCCVSASKVAPSVDSINLAMSSNHNYCFAKAGPKHMRLRADGVSSPMMIDWEDVLNDIFHFRDKEEHCRCITACIVKGTYVYANADSEINKHAPVWWESFHFSLYKKLEIDGFMFGAIYKHNPPAGKPRHQSAPAYIVAFRGTMLNHSEPLVDLLLNWKVIVNNLKKCIHFRLALYETSRLLEESESAHSSSVAWIAGHSLGAAFGLAVGRHLMIESKINLPTFLFNPPHVSIAAAINCLPNKAKNDVYKFSYLIKCKLGVIFPGHMKRMEEQFKKLLPWEPNIYVNKADIVCVGFIDYFEQRKKVAEYSPCTANLATMLSYRDFLTSSTGEEKEQPHLLPTAMLWKVTNHNPKEDPHAIKQWWMPDSMLGLTGEPHRWSGIQK